MSSDHAWSHRESGNSSDREHQAIDSSSQPQSGSQVQEWDPSAFLNPSMFSADVASPTTATPPPTLSHFQPEHSSAHVSAQLSSQGSMSSQLPAVPHLVHPDSFNDGYGHDQYGPSYDLYNNSQLPRHSYDSGHYRSSPLQQHSSDLSPSMAQLGLHQEYLQSNQGNVYQSYGQLQQGLHTQNLQGHNPFDFHQSPAISPNDRASPLARASPFTISPVSNQSFAAQQEFAGIDRRPSTAESIGSEYNEFGLGGSNALGMAPGIVPSSLHQYSQRNNSYPHLAQDNQPHPNRPYTPLVLPSHPSSGSGANQQPNGPFISPQQPYPSSHQHSHPHQQGQYGSENFHISPALVDSEGGSYPSPTSGTPEIAQYIRPVLRQYMETRNRIGFGERTVIVMASKVAQKSYGQERRFLCPPPTAIMIGNSWWTESALGRDDRRSPRVTISISGESVPPESSIEWLSTSGKTVEPGEAPPESSPYAQDDISAFQDGVNGSDSRNTQTYIGRAVGKQLFISDERQKKVEALVKVVAPGIEDETERVVGIFPSKPIKVISKPSKKRQSAKNMELCINHGSTVSLFHRLRAQTVSTKYLCVSGSGYSFKGSDGASLPGVDPAHRGNTPSFVARIGAWDPFVIYIVDVNKPQGPDVVPPAPLQPDYPTPPPNAIAVMHHGSNIPIYYNQTVVLQCLTSGVVSPVLIIRKVERDTTVVGGGLQEGAKGIPDHFCAPGEVCGDPVSQLHKVAFEVFDPSKSGPAPGSAGVTGAFLSCMGDKVNTYRPSEGRTWNNSEMSSRSQSPAIPDSPGGSSTGSMTDYFSSGSPVDSSLDGHASNGLPPSSDGGRVSSRRGAKRSNTNSGPVFKGPSKARKRVNSVGSNGSGGGSSYTNPTARFGLPDQPVSSGALWSIDIGESAVWTIVGTEQIRYNFYVPLGMPSSRASGVPVRPVTPFPNIVKYLPADRAAENPVRHGVNRMLMNPNGQSDPRNAALVTIYGENFSKTDPPLLFFGTEPSPYVDVRCQEVLACLPPPSSVDPQQMKVDGRSLMHPQPIFIVRADGVIYPSNVLFYGK
ncbi:hypothetical protein FRC14_001491 [Serendipita sp. 396]|nr:hypothetical protein FRC14_001491 [Serendipita sp. 396]